jgi:hypothetical protein
MAAMKASQERVEALMDISLETTEVCLEKTGESGKSRNQDGSVSRNDESGDYRSTGGPIRGPATGRVIPEPTEKADQGRFYKRNL